MYQCKVDDQYSFTLNLSDNNIAPMSVKLLETAVKGSVFFRLYSEIRYQNLGFYLGVQTENYNWHTYVLDTDPRKSLANYDGNSTTTC